MTPAAVERDERTVMVENASYRLASTVMSFGLLLDIAYRSWVRHESNWDLFALVILGGVVATAYQGSNGVLGPRWRKSTAAVMAAAAACAVVIVLLRRFLAP
jgi:hypothetical protein